MIGSNIFYLFYSFRSVVFDSRSSLEVRLDRRTDAQRRCKNPGDDQILWPPIIRIHEQERYVLYNIINKTIIMIFNFAI